MNRQLAKLALILLLSPLAMPQLLAQEKPGCEPKSCGPENTKTEEAKVITELRQELQEVITKMATSPLKFDAEITAFKIEKGSSDDESVLIIAQTSSAVLSELRSKVPSTKVVAELKNYQSKPGASKQKLMANLKKEVSLLSKQVSAL